jgi:hypothetical protein
MWLLRIRHIGPRFDGTMRLERGHPLELKSYGYPFISFPLFILSKIQAHRIQWPSTYLISNFNNDHCVASPVSTYLPRPSQLFLHESDFLSWNNFLWKNYKINGKISMYYAAIFLLVNFLLLIFFIYTQYLYIFMTYNVLFWFMCAVGSNQCRVISIFIILNFYNFFMVNTFKLFSVIFRYVMTALLLTNCTCTKHYCWLKLQFTDSRA